MDDFGTDEIESILYIAREISVYKIPPLKANEGHRAQDWGDLASPLWKGRMRIIEKADAVSLLFEDPSTVFAKAAYDPAKPSVEGVLDSSRYFVVRVEDSGRKAYIGMGFAERSDSFDFNVALQDYTKRWKAHLNPPSPTSDDKPSPHIPAGPKKDYSLKEGQTFSISIPGRNKAETTSSGGLFETNLLGSGATSTSSSNTSGGGGGAFPLLPPPPSAPKRR
ncbi:adaptin ear-binding coat-associated protein 1 NECAP-1 [Dentipellis sp. KUC8613]|nr:adaptin ear-binding coat-associated protein 1 NECAP-1 [Dentipellis sp. KUC8613]